MTLGLLVFALLCSVLILKCLWRKQNKDKKWLEIGLKCEIGKYNSWTNRVFSLNDCNNWTLYGNLSHNIHNWTVFPLCGYVDAPVYHSKDKNMNFFRVKKWNSKCKHTTRFALIRNPFPHTSQTNGFAINPVWYSICFCKLCLCRNDFSHCVHLYWCSVCDFWWDFSKRSVLKLRKCREMKKKLRLRMNEDE